MKNRKSFIKFTLLITGVLGFLFSQVQVPKRWEPQTRKPASALNLFENKDPKLFLDFFRPEHEMDIEFWTDKDEEALKKRAELALHSALSSTLLDSSSKTPVKELFKKNLIQELTDNFLKSLFLLKIMNGTFQIDLHFSPKELAGFEKLMESNQLVNFSNSSTLSSDLELGNKKFYEELVTRAGVESETYSNLGGTITLWIKVLDLNWNPLNPIPNPPKNAIKGFVKYRRYFRANESWRPIISSPSTGINLFAEWDKSNSPKILTVDVTKSFDLGSLIPSPDSIEIFFGDVKAPRKFKTGVVQNIDALFKNKDLNKLILKGKKGDDEFFFELAKLKFNMQSKSFSFSSRIKNHGNWSGFNLIEKKNLRKEVRHALLGDDADHLIKGLNLKRFHQSFKEVGE